MESGCAGLRGAFTSVQSALPGHLGDLYAPASPRLVQR